MLKCFHCVVCCTLSVCRTRFEGCWDFFFFFSNKLILTSSLILHSLLFPVSSNGPHSGRLGTWSHQDVAPSFYFELTWLSHLHIAARGQGMAQAKDWPPPQVNPRNLRGLLPLPGGESASLPHGTLNGVPENTTMALDSEEDGMGEAECPNNQFNQTMPRVGGKMGQTRTLDGGWCLFLWHVCICHKLKLLKFFWSSSLLRKLKILVLGVNITLPFCITLEECQPQLLSYYPTALWICTLEDTGMNQKFLKTSSWILLFIVNLFYFWYFWFMPWPERKN